MDETLNIILNANIENEGVSHSINNNEIHHVVYKWMGQSFQSVS
jgi:hypothetical protein